MLRPPFDNSRPDPDDLINARSSAGLDAAQAADLCGLSLRRWKDLERGRAPIPLAAYRLLLAVGNWLPDPAWSGWRIADGRLWSPEGQGYTPADLYSLHWHKQRSSKTAQR